MINKYILTIFIVCISAGSLVGQKVNYKLKMSNPQNHYFEVEMILEGFKQKEIEIKMPVWAPGSYLVREFSKNVNQVRAKDESNKSLKTSKKTKNTWLIDNSNKAKKISIKYEVYAFELFF